MPQLVAKHYFKLHLGPTTGGKVLFIIATLILLPHLVATFVAPVGGRTHLKWVLLPLP